jgi:large subunit ribosomal protein L4
MATIPILDVDGKKVADRNLAPEIFEARISLPLMHQVVVAGLASVRTGTHSTKTRGEVSGGGKKPWRQKGTGRARQGSNRAPQWRGGGIVHGPKPRSHDVRVNKKMKRGALRAALTDAARSGKLVVVEDLPFDEPKTKRAAEILTTLELFGRVLLVLPMPTDGAVERSFRNLPNVKLVYAPSLGTYDVMAADRVLFTKAALDIIEGREAPASDIDSRVVSGSRVEEGDR